MLTIRSLKSFYDTICALKAVSLHVGKGEIVTLIGGNGSGKSTLLKAILGLIPRSTGSINFEDREILGSPPSAIVKAGIALVPEGRQLFAPMTVMDNLLLGAYPYYRFSRRKEAQDTVDWICTVFPVLSDRRKQLAGTLSGGEQQMLSIARALMSRPKLILLDEPSIGLAPKIVEGIFRSLVELREKTALTVFLVEQNARMALDICQRAYVIETGQVILSGEREELLNNREVLRAYLGKE
jgi:branched-chain amino acid transport system ATP-binding protein